MRHKEELAIGLRLIFWAITPDATDTEARNAYAKKWGRLPATLIRHGPIILLGPIVEGNPMQGLKP